MALFSKPIQTLGDLFDYTLHVMFYAESELAKDLRAMADMASDEALRSAARHHLEQTLGHAEHLTRILKLRGREASVIVCPAVDGFLSEAKGIIADSDDPEVRDAAMLSAAQAVEHYEISRYGTLIAYARQFGCAECEPLLRRIIEEERAADRTLTEVATGRINQAAARRTASR